MTKLEIQEESKIEKIMKKLEEYYTNNPLESLKDLKKVEKIFDYLNNNMEIKAIKIMEGTKFYSIVKKDYKKLIDYLDSNPFVIIKDFRNLKRAYRYLEKKKTYKALKIVKRTKLYLTIKKDHKKLVRILDIILIIVKTKRVIDFTKIYFFIKNIFNLNIKLFKFFNIDTFFAILFLNVISENDIKENDFFKKEVVTKKIMGYLNSKNKKSFFISSLWMFFAEDTKDLNKKILAYKEAVRFNPKNKNAYFKLSEIYFANEQYENAEKYLMDFLNLDTENIEANKGMGDIYLFKKEHDKSIQYFKKVLNLDSENIYSYNGLGYNYFHFNKYDDASDMFNEVLKRDKNNLEAIHGLGQIFFNLGNFKKSIKLFEKAISLNTDNLDSYYYLGDSYFKEKMYKDAIDIFNKSIIIDSQKIYPYQGISDSYFKINNFEKAITFSKKAITLDNNNIYSYILLANSTFKQGRYSHSIKYCQKIICLEPYNDLIHEKLIDAHLIEKKEIALIEYYNNIYKKIIEKDLSKSVNPDILRISKKDINTEENLEYNKRLLFLYKKLYNVNGIYKKNVIYYSEKVFDLEDDKLGKEILEYYKEKIEKTEKATADMAHKIKNLVSSIITPLDELDFGDKNYVKNYIVNDAKLIADMTNSINLSYNGKRTDFLSDIKIEKKEKLNDILFKAFVLAFNNIFDGRNYGKFQLNYIKDDNSFHVIKDKWNKFKSSSFESLKLYLEEYFFDFEINIDENNLEIGDEKSSQTKFTLMFQEILLNAIKYSSFVDRKDRFIKIDLIINDKINFEVKNSFNNKANVITTGHGHTIIDNFSKLLSGKCALMEKDNYNYSVIIKFDNFWRKE